MTGSSSAGAGKASLALVSGKVVPDPLVARAFEAIAVAGSDVLAVGSDEEVRDLVGPRTRVVDLRGRLVLPAFGDAHVHPVSGGLESLRCDLSGLRTRAACLDAVAAFSRDLPADAWVLGGGWSMESFPGGVPDAADLDAVVGGRPAFLPNRDHHSAWVSSGALALAGIDASTPDPKGGRIERRADGSPSGALHEDAMRLVARLIPRPGPEELMRALVAGQRRLHAVGITHYQDACVGEAGELGVPDTFDTYVRAAADGTLTAQVVGALWWDRLRGPEQLDDLRTRREKAGPTLGEGVRHVSGSEGATGSFRASTVKIMVDGVCETFTAAMLTPYLDCHGHETSNCGISFVDPADLREYLVRLDAEGFQVHVHAIGDRGVREALDAVQAARQHNPTGLARHHLAHLQVVHPEDLERFTALRVTANFQPLWACEEPQMVELTMPFLGPERSAQQYPIGSLARRGTHVAFGSDWPVSTPDPFAEMHVAVNRTPPPEDGRDGASPFLPDERVGLEDAVRYFTAGSARVNSLDEVAGSISVGKAADMVLLDRDLFAVDRADGGIAGCRAALTFVGGEVVFEQG